MNDLKSSKSVCMLCITRSSGRSTSNNDHFCNGSKTIPWRGSPVTGWTSCSTKTLLDRNFPLRGKLAILAQGLANWLGGFYD